MTDVKLYLNILNESCLFRDSVLHFSIIRSVRFIYNSVQNETTYRGGGWFDSWLLDVLLLISELFQHFLPTSVDISVRLLFDKTTR